MMRRLTTALFLASLMAVALAPLAALTAAAPPVVSWTFDEARETGVAPQATERLDSLQGAIESGPGVRGSGLKFDGLTSRLVRAAICVSTSHVAHDSIRMEPVFMALAQSAAIAAGLAIDKNVSVQDVAYPALREKLEAAKQILRPEAYKESGSPRTFPPAKKP